MEAGSRLRRTLISLFSILLIGVMTSTAQAANQRTRNFIVVAPTQDLANAVATAAEKYRRDLATYWLGQPLPAWPAPCPIRVVAGPNLAAQGVTTYNPRPVRDFQMEVVGTPQRILDSVLPHEVTHTVLATHFGRPLPRWADEGICTTVEHEAERDKHEIKLREFLRSRRGIAMNQLFLMTEYPNDVLPLYAQGYSVCQFLIHQKGPRTFINFLQDYMQRPSWTANVRKHYGYDSLKELQDYWVAWVESGSGDVTKFAKIQPGASQTLLAQVSATETPKGLALNDATGNAQGVAVATLNGRANSTAIALAGPANASRASSVGQGTPVNQVKTATMPPVQGTALASTASNGWYQRRRTGVMSRSEPSAPTEQADPAGPAASPIAPPSVFGGRYQSSQPQPEQGISRPPISYDRGTSGTRWR